MVTHIPCPVTNALARAVDSATLKCLLSISIAEVADRSYYFCPDPDCDVVYFDEEDTNRFYHTDVRERVYQKTPLDDDVLVCYCFQYTRGQVRREVESTGESSITAEIIANVRAGKCACDWRNPQGSCCLGNVKRLIAPYLTG